MGQCSLSSSMLAKNNDVWNTLLFHTGRTWQMINKARAVISRVCYWYIHETVISSCEIYKYKVLTRSIFIWSISSRLDFSK